MFTASYLVNTYAIYTTIAVILTGALAHTLSRRGSVFLRDVFDEPETATAVNSLLVIGFYMLNLGYAFLIFRTEGATTQLSATENLVEKLGLLLVSLGVIHFANMWVFWRIRNRGIENNTFPLPPTAPVAPPPPPPAQPNPAAAAATFVPAVGATPTPAPAAEPGGPDLGRNWT